MDAATNPVIEQCRREDIPADEEDVFGWQTDLFDTWQYGLEWAKSDWRFRLRIADRPVAHLGVLQRAVTVGGHSETVGGMGGLVTVPAMRGRGLATLLLDHAQRFVAEELGLQFAMGFVVDRMLSFYRERGWQQIDGRVTIDQPTGKRLSPCSAFVLPLASAEWPRGDIDIGGLPW